MKEAQTPSGSSLWLESISILWYMRRRGGSGWVGGGGQMRLADCYSETWRCAGRKTRPAPRENLYTDKRGKKWRVCVCVRGRKYEERHGSQLLQRFIFWTPPNSSHTHRYCHRAIPSFQRWFKKRLQERTRFLYSRPVAMVTQNWVTPSLPLLLSLSFSWSNHQIST